MSKEKRDYSNRILELDLLRGVCVLLMIFDHFMSNVYDLMPYLFSDFPSAGFWSDFVLLASKYWEWWLRNAMHYIVCFAFLSLTGICSAFSRSNIKRGLKLMGVALLVTLATFLFGKATDNLDMMITFGVLHCIALTLIVIGIMQKFVDNPWVYLIIGLVMTAIGIYIEANTAMGWYENGINPFMIMLEQIIGTRIYGMDCFPFLQNGGQIFIGVFLGKMFYKERKSIFNWKYSNNLLTFVGRNSLLVYVLHQVILPVAMGLILLMFGFHFGL